MVDACSGEVTNAISVCFASDVEIKLVSSQDPVEIDYVRQYEYTKFEGNKQII